MSTGIPISFGVVTALNEEQARERAGGVVANRGEEAALAALEMAEWMTSVKLSGRGRRSRVVGKAASIG